MDKKRGPYDKLANQQQDRNMDNVLQDWSTYANYAALLSLEKDPLSKAEIYARMEAILARCPSLQGVLESYPSCRRIDALSLLANRASRDRIRNMVQRSEHESGGAFRDNRVRGEIGRGLSFVCSEIPDVRKEIPSYKPDERPLCGCDA